MPKLEGVRERRHQPAYDTLVVVDKDGRMIDRYTGKEVRIGEMRHEARYDTVELRRWRWYRRWFWPAARAMHIPGARRFFRWLDGKFDVGR